MGSGLDKPLPVPPEIELSSMSSSFATHQAYLVQLIHEITNSFKRVTKTAAQKTHKSTSKRAPTHEREYPREHQDSTKRASNRESKIEHQDSTKSLQDRAPTRQNGMMRSIRKKLLSRSHLNDDYGMYSHRDEMRLEMCESPRLLPIQGIMKQGHEQSSWLQYYIVRYYKNMEEENIINGD
jgi:hypothetical protein